jgi:hypothetical protein
MLSSLCIRTPGAGHASERAELLRYLLDHGHSLELASLNVRLETPVHCALRSSSFEVLEVCSPLLHSRSCCQSVLQGRGLCFPFARDDCRQSTQGLNIRGRSPMNQDCACGHCQG